MVKRVDIAFLGCILAIFVIAAYSMSAEELSLDRKAKVRLVKRSACIPGTGCEYQDALNIQEEQANFREYSPGKRSSICIPGTGCELQGIPGAAKDQAHFRDYSPGKRSSICIPGTGCEFEEAAGAAKDQAHFRDYSPGKRSNIAEPSPSYQKPSAHSSFQQNQACFAGTGCTHNDVIGSVEDRNHWENDSPGKRSNLDALSYSLVKKSVCLPGTGCEHGGVIGGGSDKDHWQNESPGKRSNLAEMSYQKPSALFSPVKKSVCLPGTGCENEGINGGGSDKDHWKNESPGKRSNLDDMSPSYQKLFDQSSLIKKSVCLPGTGCENEGVIGGSSDKDHWENNSPGKRSNLDDLSLSYSKLVAQSSLIKKSVCLPGTGCENQDAIGSGSDKDHWENNSPGKRSEYQDAIGGGSDKEHWEQNSPGKRTGNLVLDRDHWENSSPGKRDENEYFREESPGKRFAKESEEKEAGSKQNINTEKQYWEMVSPGKRIYTNEKDYWEEKSPGKRIGCIYGYKSNGNCLSKIEAIKDKLALY